MYVKLNLNIKKTLEKFCYLDYVIIYHILNLIPFSK